MNKVLNIYDTCSRFPMGKILFSKLICFIAPYYKSINAKFVDLRPGYCEIKIKKRRAVQNHLKTVHAIAMCNMCELAGGTLMEATLPPAVRWIPKGMTVEYLKMAKTDLKGICSFDRNDWNITEPEEFPVVINIIDTNGVEVMRGTINMYLTPNSQKSKP